MREAGEAAGDPPPDGEHGVAVEVGEQPLGDDRQPAVAIEAGGDRGEALLAVLAERVERDDPVLGAERAGALQGPALAPGHLGQVGLYIGDALAVALREAPAARRHAGRDFDHLGDLAALDGRLQQPVDQQVAGEQEVFEPDSAERLADRHRRPRREVHQPPGRGLEGRDGRGRCGPRRRR